MNKIRLPASLEQLNFVNEKLKEIMQGELKPLLSKTQLIVEELLANVCNYAYEGKNGSADFICGKVSFDGMPYVMISITDKGIPFEPFVEADAPDLDADIEERQIGGLGIFFVKEIASHYTYARIEDSNVVTIYIAINQN